MKLSELFEGLFESITNDIYYHATGSKFDQFSDKFTGKVGFYFTKDYNHALTFKPKHGGRVIHAHLDIKKPATEEALNMAEKHASKYGGGNPRKMIIELLKSKGFDAIIRQGETIVFDPEQIHIIKSDDDKSTITDNIPQVNKGVFVLQDEERFMYAALPKFIKSLSWKDAIKYCESFDDGKWSISSVNFLDIMYEKNMLNFNEYWTGQKYPMFSDNPEGAYYFSLKYGKEFEEDLSKFKYVLPMKIIRK